MAISSGLVEDENGKISGIINIPLTNQSLPKFLQMYKKNELGDIPFGDIEFSLLKSKRVFKNFN